MDQIQNVLIKVATIDKRSEKLKNLVSSTVWEFIRKGLDSASEHGLMPEDILEIQEEINTNFKNYVKKYLKDFELAKQKKDREQYPYSPSIHKDLNRLKITSSKIAKQILADDNSDWDIKKFDKVLFKDIAIGDSFYSISKGAGIHRDVNMIMIYIKTSKSRAKCTNQIGYGNTRALDGIYTFAPNSLVLVKI